MKNFRKELERIFNIPKVIIEKNRLKRELEKEKSNHKKDNDDRDFYKVNYENDEQEIIELKKELKLEKELHKITKQNLQQANGIIKEHKEKNMEVSE